MRPPQLPMGTVNRRINTSDVRTWRDSPARAVVAACVCDSLCILSQDDTAILGRKQGVGGEGCELNPDFRKIDWWWRYWTHSSLIQGESTWKVVFVETEELVGQTISNPHFSGWCSLLQTLQNSRAMVGSQSPVSGDLFEYMLLRRPCRMCLFIWSEKERKNSYHLSEGVMRVFRSGSVFRNHLCAKWCKWIYSMLIYSGFFQILGNSVYEGIVFGPSFFFLHHL